MLIQTISPDRFRWFCQNLRQSAQIAPLEASYTVPLMVNDTEYTVRLQPFGENQIAVLQALRIDREENGPTFTLIEDDDLLFSFLTLLLKQGMA